MTSNLVLLRGINVDGRNKVPMAELRSVVEDLGFSNVSTYIASGNVLLDSDMSDAKVVSTIEAALPKAFKLDAELIRIAVLSWAELEGVVKNRPTGLGDEPAKYKNRARSVVADRVERQPVARHQPGQQGHARRVFEPRVGTGVGHDC